MKLVRSRLAWSAWILGLAWWAWSSFRMLRYALPHYEAESAMAWSTHLLLQGQSPWSLANYPVSLNAYGIGYHWLCAPFAWLLGCNLVVHRGVSLACLVAAAVLVQALARRQCWSPLAAAWAALACLMGWALYITPTARPDALVTLCYLGVLAWTEQDEASLPAACNAGALAALAFYVKPYGVVAGVFGAASLAWRRQWKPALALLVVQGAVWLVLALLIRRSHPLYFEEVFLVNSNIAGADPGHRWSQWVELFPLMAAPLALIGIALLGSRQALGQGLRQPWVLVLALAALLFHFKLSLHTGARLTYFMQLGFPLLLLAAGQLWARSERPAWVWPASMGLVTLLLALKLSVGAYGSIAAEDQAAQSIAETVAPRYYSAGSGHMAWWLWSRGGVLFDAGQAEFAHYAETVPAWGRAFFTHGEALRERREHVEAGFARAVAQGRFGRIALGGQGLGPIEAASAQAQPLGRVNLSTPQVPYFQTSVEIFQRRTPTKDPRGH